MSLRLGLMFYFSGGIIWDASFVGVFLLQRSLKALFSSLGLGQVLEFNM